MGGGNWDRTSLPVLPGLYMNFTSAAQAAIVGGDIGTAFIPIKSEWGPVGKTVVVSTEADIIHTYGRDPLFSRAAGSNTSFASVSKSVGRLTGMVKTDNQVVIPEGDLYLQQVPDMHENAYKLLRLCLLGKPKKIKAWRLAGKNAAKSFVMLTDKTGKDAVKIEALYEGERGNGFYLALKQSLKYQYVCELSIFESVVGQEVLLRKIEVNPVDKFSFVDTVNSDEKNIWIKAEAMTSNAPIELFTRMALVGGHSGTLNVSDYVTAFEEWGKEEFNCIALDEIDIPDLQTSFCAWIKSLRDDNGQKVFGVIGGNATDDKDDTDAVQIAIERSNRADYEGIINVGNGAYLDGKEYSSAALACYVAGLICGQKLRESTTYATTVFSDVNRRWSKFEQEQAVKNGVFLFFKPSDLAAVKVLKGINTLRNYRQDQNYSFTKIRIMRLLDKINNDLLETSNRAFIGRLNNNYEGRKTLVAGCEEYLRVYAVEGLIENKDYKVYLDPIYYGKNPPIKPLPDQVFLKWEAIPTDVMEQIFGTFIVK